MKSEELERLIKEELGWVAKVKYKDLVNIMVHADLDKYNQS